MRFKAKIYFFFTCSLLICIGLSSCQSQLVVANPEIGGQIQESVDSVNTQTVVEEQGDTNPTNVPSRPTYNPGELVDYIAQTGDTLAAMAVHFNTSVDEILEVNLFIPESATTMPPGMPMQIPIYYAPFWGSQFQILPDGLFINGPAQVGFNVEEFVSSHPGWLNGYFEYAAGENRSGAQIVELVAKNFSISPRLLLALLDYQTGAITQSNLQEGIEEYTLGFKDWRRKGLYLQLLWAANTLNNGYYGWRTGKLSTFEHTDGRMERPDPWQNAASVALHYYYSKVIDKDEYARAIAHDGFYQTYVSIFGDPWQDDTAHIPGSLSQPEFKLPFNPGVTWAFTGGPHTAWGEGEPLSALDFAPGSITGGCTPTSEWTTAVAPGVIARSEPAVVVLDLDGDGDERTGWSIFYFHIGSEGRASTGAVLQIGDPIGLPSCEGGRTTGTHVHLARKFNGEWIPADGTLAFNLDGWIAHDGASPYQGRLTRNSQSVIACVCSDKDSHIEADEIR
jgi:hypothetical protein